MRYFIALLLATGFTCACAAEQPAAGAATAEQPAEAPNGAAQWLELQRSDAQAGEPNPVPGEAVDRIYKRYLDSFEQPIPSTFPRTRTTR